MSLALRLFALEAHALDQGAAAPKFQAVIQTGATIGLETHPDKATLLYFYPKDETPGCTEQACKLRDDFTKFETAGIIVYGVSRQSVESHRKFKEHHRLPYDLIADEEGKLGKLYGIETIPVIGLFKRQSVLIGRDGKVLKIYKSVDPKTHAALVLADFAAMGGNAAGASSPRPVQATP